MRTNRISCSSCAGVMRASPPEHSLDSLRDARRSWRRGIPPATSASARRSTAIQRWWCCSPSARRCFSPSLARSPKQRVMRTLCGDTVGKLGKAEIFVTSPEGEVTRHSAADERRHAVI